MTLRAGTLVLLSLVLSAYAYSGTDPSATTIPIHLGTADLFALLGGSGITNVDAGTYIIGDVGSSPTPSVTGLIPSQVRGHLYLKSNATTAKAQKGLTVAYGEAAAAKCGHDLTGKDLGGMKLGPGVYCFSSSAQLTGTLTLNAHGDPNAQWIFQTGSTLTTASNSTVRIILGKGQQAPPPWGKGARGCNVYWQITSSATLGSGSTFVGIIMALQSITTNGGVLKGKALASNGAVTMGGTAEMVDGPACQTHVLNGVAVCRE